ncbi:hypothetical protein [Sagittula sp. S175]|uniref:hypothetical protein n=1 Tax=Sagittula sp. S175 TaxID=3415129 RepID=UPI003C79A77C
MGAVTNKPILAGADFLLGIQDNTFGRVERDTAALQMIGVGPIAEEFAALRGAITGGVLAAASWGDLAARTTSADGTAADVPLSDEGFHQQATATGYDGALVPNAGRYSYRAAWGRWLRVGEYGAAASDVLLTATGTGNAISATSDRTYAKAPYAAKFVLPVVTANTGAVTIGIDGGTARALVTSAGGALEAGNLLPGQIIEFRWDGEQYRLAPGVTTAAAVQRAEDAAQAAEADRILAGEHAERADSEGNATLALQYRDQARSWAEQGEDVEVETDQFSALHHAAKAAAAQSASDEARVLSQGARDVALAAVAAAGNYYNATTLAAAVSTAEAALTAGDRYAVTGGDVSYVSFRVFDDPGSTELWQQLKADAPIADVNLTGSAAAENLAVSGVLSAGGTTFEAMILRLDGLELQNRILRGQTVALMGHDGQSEGVPRGNSRVSTSAPAKARMFASGVWPHFVSTPNGFPSALVADTSANGGHNIYMDRLTSLVPLAEYDDDGGKESLCTGCAWWMQNVDTVSWYVGQGSQTVASLSGEGIHLTSEALMLVQFGALVRAEGKEPVWPFSIFTQGHADAAIGTDPEVWKQAVLDLQRYRTDLASAAWGYAVPLVPHITEVMNNSGYAGTTTTQYAQTRAIMQAQSVIAEENDSIHCAGPTYQWPTEDAVHTDSRERRLRGEMFGKVGKLIADGLTWEHCNIRSASVAGSDITVTIHAPVGDLVSDTVLIDNPGSLGFEVFDSGGTALTISSVIIGATVGGLCDVTVTVASGTPATLRYAMQSLAYKGGPGVPNPTFGGARGCLRDSDTAVALYDGTPLYNWLCPKEVSL